jgi:sugar phosphate isomerase/epimerase
MAKQVQIAAQLYTLRDFLKTPADIAAAMPRVRKAGYATAQISGVGPIDPAELRRIMLDAGVEPIGAHVGVDQFRNDLAGTIATCRQWGIGYVAIPWLDCSKLTTVADWKVLAKEFNAFGKACASEGIVLQYHNHMFEFEKFGVKNGRGGMTFLEMLFKYTNPKYLQAELDLGWVARGNENLVAWIGRMKGRLDQVHLKDWGVKANQPVWRAVGEGGIDWPPVLKACKAAGTTCFIVEQDACPITNDPFLSLAVSRQNLKKMGLG